MTKPRVLNEHWRHQYDRMQRSRDRLRNMPHVFPDYDDAFFHAVQDAWHLKDWLYNDDTLLSLRDRLDREVHKCSPLLVIADIANCTKHLVLRDPPKTDAIFDSSNAEVNYRKSGKTKRWFAFRFKNSGAVREGTELLDEAIAEWDRLLKRHGLL